MHRQFELNGKSALVIGASNVIGRAAAVTLAEAGANVAVATTTKAQQEAVKANSCANEIWALNRKGFAESIDAASEGDVRALVDKAVSELGRIDILVNAPSLPFAKPLPEISLDEWTRAISANLTSVFLSCRIVGEKMLAQGHGRIINISSLLGERGMANGTALCAAEAGVLNFTRALALEWARSGVNVNAVGAGWTEGMGLLTDKDAKEQLARYLPYKRLAQPEEITGAVLYLAADVSAYLTGQVIWVEGGALSHV